MTKKRKKSNDTGEIIARRFGRYLILDHLVNGGMARICRARFLGEQADKIVAIKMIQSQYSQDENFKKMFMDEVKVSFGLIHPNIAQTYDYGIQDSQLYTAMEYVDGKNLKEFLDKLKEKKFVFPVEISIYIISQVCQGLHYAHTYTDKLTGKRVNIIHRDISPHNVMLTFDGAVKVIDFGIAKAESITDSTQAGTIKGKLSYLAPEYLEGLQLDARYDEFAVGITLWEMLCGRRLFKANNELAVLKEIQKCQIPTPSSINPNVSKELDHIVMRALQKDRNLRFENLDQLNRALVRYLYINYPDFNATDIAYFARELFSEHIKKDRERLKEFGKIDITPFLDDMKRESNGGGPSTTPNTGDDGRKTNIIDFGFENESLKKTISGKNVESAPNKLEMMQATAPLQKPDLRQSRRIVGQIEKTKARSSTAIHQMSLDKDKSKKRSNSPVNNGLSQKNASDSSNHITKFAAIAAVLAIVYYGVGNTNLEQLKFWVDRQPAGKEEILIPVSPTLIKGHLILPNYKKTQHKVFINGEIAEVNVFNEVELSVNTEYVLRVESSDRQHWVHTFSLTPEKKKYEIPIANTPITYYGYLFTEDANCAQGKIEFELFGEKRQEVIPITNPQGIAFPVGKTEINLRLNNDNLNRKKMVIIKNPNESVDFCNLMF